MMRHSIRAAATLAVLTGCSDDLGPDLAACTAKTMEIYRSAQVSDERTAAYLRECMIRNGWPLRDSCLDKRYIWSTPGMLSQVTEAWSDAR
jgi:hypothetical protein